MCECVEEISEMFRAVGIINQAIYWIITNVEARGTCREYGEIIWRWGILSFDGIRWILRLLASIVSEGFGSLSQIDLGHYVCNFGTIIILAINEKFVDFYLSRKFEIFNGMIEIFAPLRKFGKKSLFEIILIDFAR